LESKQNDPNILNDLIKINNDRIAGYKLAIDLANEQGEGAREAVFRQFIEQSEAFIEDLTPQVELAGQYASDRTKLSGELCRQWMVIKSKIAGGKRTDVVE
jgi:uncharacterized protein (TIGR02284 family)